MSESQSPIICVTCKRPFPGDLKAADAPRYFGQSPLLPKSDSDSDFISEARVITEFISAIADVLSWGDHKNIEQKTYDTIFQLVAELSAEALRRQQLALDATEEIWKRDHEKEFYERARAAEQATHARKQATAYPVTLPAPLVLAALAAQGTFTGI